MLATALIVRALPDRVLRAGRALCALLTALSLAALLWAAASVFSGGHVDQVLGEPVPGVALALRADGPALVVACLASVAALVALVNPRLPRSDLCGLMVCLLGALICALAAGLTGLFAGLEVGNLGALLLMGGGSHRMSRRALAAFAVQHVASLGVLVVAVDLQVSRGSTDLGALAVVPLGAGQLLPWLLAGSVRVLAPAAGGDPVYRRTHFVWMGVAAVPSGLVVLLRLAQATDGHLMAPLPLVVGLCASTVALYGSLVALRCHREAAAAGRGLCIATSGMTVAAFSVTGDAGHEALAALAVALVLSLISAPAWNSRHITERGRWLAAMGLLAAGGLPLGFGTTAVLLGLDAVTFRGLPGALLLLLLGPSAALAGVAAGLAARHRLTALIPNPDDEPPPPVRWEGGVGLALSCAGALLPGLAVSWVVGPLAGADVAATDAGAVRGPGGGWSGGYVAAAVILALAMVGSALVLIGALPRAARHLHSPVGGHPRPSGATSRRRTATPRTADGSSPGHLRGWDAPLVWLGAARRHVIIVDRWLVGQPQLLWVLAGIAVSAFMLR
ncbi:MAG: hypothetical protein ABR564_01950 [Candidatus Dormibacteria bacterium]